MKEAVTTEAASKTPAEHAEKANADKAATITLPANLVNDVFQIEKDGVYVFGHEALVKLEDATVEKQGNVRTNYTTSAVSKMLHLMETGAYDHRLPNSSLLLRKQGGRMVVPDGLTRVRAARLFWEKHQKPPAPMNVHLCDGMETGLVNKFTNTGRPRSLEIRCKLKDEKGKPIPAKVNKIAVQVVRFILGSECQNFYGHYQPEPDEVEAKFDEWREAINFVLKHEEFRKQPALKRTPVLAAMVMLYLKNRPRAKEFITAVAEMNARHNIKQAATLFSWLSSKASQPRSAGPLIKTLHCGTAYCAQCYLDDHKIIRVQSERNYLLNGDGNGETKTWLR